MIWEGYASADRDRCALRDYIAGSLNQLDPVRAMVPDQVEALADAVSVFCLTDLADSCISDDLLWLTVSRCLFQTGYEEVAREVLSRFHCNESESQSYLRIVRDPSMVMPMWSACAARVVRPYADGTAVATKKDETWVIDLTRLRSQEAEWLELTHYHLLRTLLGQLASLWDETQGRGVVGLVGPVEPSKKSRNGLGGTRSRLEEEGLAYCRDVLRREKTRRGWSHEPVVMGLGLPAQRRKRHTAR